MTATVSPLRPFSNLMLQAQLQASLEPDELDGAEILELAGQRLIRQGERLIAEAAEVRAAAISQFGLVNGGRDNG